MIKTPISFALGLAAALALGTSSALLAQEQKYQTPMSFEEEQRLRVLNETAGQGPRRSYEGPARLNTWSLTVNGGITRFYGDLQQGDFFSKGPKQRNTYGVGLALNKQLSHLFGVSAHFNTGTLSGSKDRTTYVVNNPRTIAYGPSYFTNDFRQLTLNADVNLKTLVFGTQKLRRWKVDASVGYGLMWFRTNVFDLRTDEELRFSNSPASSLTARPEWQSQGTRNTREVVLPTALALTYELTPRFDIGLRGTLNHVFSEKLDMTFGGIDNSIPGNIFTFKKGSSSFDKYGQMDVTVTYKLGRRAAKVSRAGEYPTDNDQVYHLRWTEPSNLIPVPYNPTLDTAVARVKAIMPEPVDPRLYTDTDGDGVADLFDKEVDTPPNSIVSGAGVALDLEKLLKQYVDRKIPAQTCTQLFGNVEFRTDQSTIPTAAYQALNDLIAYLNQTDCRVILVGHADRRESDAYNQRLSQRRAQSVRKYLTQNGLKDPSRIVIEAYGELKPTAPNDRPEEGMRLNRRVELRVRPMNQWRDYPGN
jgi:OOP family OmpA-OmpF porin